MAYEIWQVPKSKNSQADALAKLASAINDKVSRQIRFKGSIGVGGVGIYNFVSGMDTFEGVSESAEGGVGVGEVRNNVLDSDPSNNNNAVVTQTGKRRRKLTSAVWTPFEILPIDDNNEQRAKCMKYGQKYLCDSRYGTRNLKRHIESCVKTDTRDLGQLLLSKSDGAILTRSSSKFLKVFYDVTCLFSGTKYPTANLYFPQVFVVEDTLRKAKVDSDSFMKSMATQMMEKFDKYWKDASNGARSHVDDMVSKECLDVMKKFDNFESEEFTTSTQKTQLQLYLDETKIDRKTKLNVLVFWKVNQFRYPELSILARDLLSIPISTVASELAFSVGGRVLDQYRSALKPENVEALVCTRDWIFGEDNSTLAPNLEELTENISKMEINATDSAKGSNTVTVGGQS
ncbi:unnamed protein product [Prunus armeniaca]